jgi:hypothetical protein
MATAPHEVQDVDVDGDGDDGDGDDGVFLSPEVYWSMRGAHRTTGFLPFPFLPFSSLPISFPQVTCLKYVDTTQSRLPTIYPSISVQVTHSTAHSTSAHSARTSPQLTQLAQLSSTCGHAASARIRSLLPYTLATVT